MAPSKKKSRQRRAGLAPASEPPNHMRLLLLLAAALALASADGVLVLGSGGLVGRAVVRWLSERGHEVLEVPLPPPALPPITTLFLCTAEQPLPLFCSLFCSQVAW